MIFSNTNLDNLFNQFNMADTILDYFQSIHTVESLSITKQEDILSTKAHIRQYPGAYPEVSINLKQRTLNFSCSCAQHKTHKMCKHIGSLIILIHGLNNHIHLPYNRSSFYIDHQDYPYIQHRLHTSLYSYNYQIAFAKETIESFKTKRMDEFNFNQTSDPIDIQLSPKPGYSSGLFTIKIGQSRLYKVRDFNYLMTLFNQQEKHTYGKSYSLLHDDSLLNKPSYEILRFFNQHQTSLVCHHDKSAIHINEENIDDFFHLFSNLPKCYSSMKFKSVPTQIKLFVEMLPFENQSCYKVYTDEPFSYMMQSKTSFYDWDINTSTLFHYPFDKAGKTVELLSLLSEDDPLYIMKEDLNAFYQYCIKDIESYFDINDLLPHVSLKEATSLQLYADINDEDMITLNLHYKLDEKPHQWFDTSIQTVDSDVEKIENYISNIADRIDQQTAFISLKNKHRFSLLNEGFTTINKYAEIFVSDAISTLKKPKSLNLSVGISLQNDLLKIDIDSIHVDKNEISDILNSFKRKKQFHRLKSGEMLNLNYQELEEIDHFLNQLGVDYPQTNTSILMPSYRLFNLENNDMDYQSIDINRNERTNLFIKQFNDTQENALSIPNHFKSVLKDYQIEGVNWLHKIKSYGFGGILADDMGLGKTLQTICFIEAHHQPGYKHLIITPASLILNWEAELIKFNASLKFICIHGNAEARGEKLNQIKDYDIIITSYDYLKRDIDQLINYHFENTFLDEAQYIKNKKTKAATVCKLIDTTSRFALTGTPIENSLAELWSIFDYLMPNYLYSYSYFSKEFEKPIVKNQDAEVSEHLKKLVHPFILRRTKDVLENMPDKNEETLTYAFNPIEKNLYVSQLTLINQELADKLEITSKDKIVILSMITRLRQICCEPRLIYDNIVTPSTKLLGALQLILRLKEEGKHLLLFSSFTSTLDLISQELDRFGLTYLTLTGKTSKKQRQENVERFQNNEADVFLISLKAGGTGLNLTQAQAVIHFDPWWNVSAQNQATDRAYRIGQDKDVHVYKLIMEDSIEQRIQTLQEMKKGLSDTFVEGNTQNITSMNFDEIIDLLK